MSNSIDAPSSPKLPAVLFRPIINNFAMDADRRTLCNAALASKLLAQECQRVLFRTTDSVWKLNSMGRHIRFLLAIIGAPTRLGPLVHEYAQHTLSMNASGPPIPDDALGMELWQMTMAALPAMVNLKHLQFSTTNIPSEASFEVLKKCTFNLISFSWTLPRSHPDIGNQAEAFVVAHKGLLHLDLSHFAEPISAGVCPDLVSIRATHRLWADLCLKDNHCIRSLYVVDGFISRTTPGVENNIDNNTQRDLVKYTNQLRVLSCPSYAKLQSAFGELPLRNLVLLRLLKYTTMTLLQLSGFDSLRVLVLHKLTRETPSEGVVSTHLMSIFQRNANVLYVDLLTEDNDVFQRFYRPALDDIDPTPTFRLFLGDQAQSLWWECHLDEANYVLQGTEDNPQGLNRSAGTGTSLSLKTDPARTITEKSVHLPRMHGAYPARRLVFFDPSVHTAT